MESIKIFYREFSRQGVKVNVIVPKKIKLDSVYADKGFLMGANKDIEPSYNLIPIDLVNVYRYSLGFCIFQLFKAIKKTNPDIIYVLEEYTSFHTTQAIFCRNILYKRKVPILTYTFQNIQFKPSLVRFSFKDLKGAIKKIIYPLIFKYNRKYVDGVIGVSTEAINNAKDFKRNVPTKRIFWGVDFSSFYPKERNRCRRKVSIPEDIKLVGYFGRIIEEKGLDKLSEAISKLEKHYLMLIGNGNYEQRLKRIIDSLGIKDKVYFYNTINNNKLVDYYNCLDVFVLPSQVTSSWKEQYGRVLVEAMACNIAVIGSSSGAIPEILNGYPKHLIFREGNVSDLVDKIKKIEKLKLTEDFNAQEFLTKFGVENFVSKHIEFYESLLKRRDQLI